MNAFLRLIGIVNAAVWFGAAFFLTACAAPAIFSPELKRLFGQAHIGLIAQAVLSTFFVLQYWCGGIALLHLLAEWFYLWQRPQRYLTGVLVGLYCLALMGGLWLQPQLQHWHRVKYSTELYRQEVYSPAQKAEAAKLFGLWHGVSQVFNLVTLGGLAFYLWRLSLPAEGPRFLPTGKFRS